MRKLMTAIALVLVASPALAQSAAEGAQPERRAERAMRGPLLGQIEQALRLRSQLDLGEDQIQRLDALRRQQLERQAAREDARRDLMSRMRAGLLERGEADRTLFEQRERMRAEADEVRARFDEILTEDQRERLRERRAAAARAAVRGERSRRTPRARMWSAPAPRPGFVPPRARRAPRAAPAPWPGFAPPRGLRAPRAAPAPRAPRMAPRFFERWRAERRLPPGAYWRERE